MKNRGLLKTLGIMLLVTFILTWVIPSSIIGEGITIGSIAPTGFADIFTSLEVITTYFIIPTIFILFVGMFYGVANASGAFKAAVNKLTSAFKNKKNLFVILTVLFYSLMAALCGIYLQMFMFLPLSIAVLFGLKYNKTQSILATVGASIIGLTARIFNSNLLLTVGAESDKYIWIKVGLLVVLLITTILYIIKVPVKKDKADSSEDKLMFIPSARSVKKKKEVSGTAFLIIVALIFVVFVLGFTPWKTTIFSKAYDAIKGVKVLNFAIFSSILGTFETFGSWTISSAYVTVALSILVLSLIYRLSFSEMVDESYNGAKKVMSIAIIAALINMVVIYALNSGFVGTVVNFIAKGGNIALVTLSSFISVPFMVDFSYAMNYLLSIFYYAGGSESALPLYGNILQFTYGFTMLALPSSVLLMVGLGYVEESYTKWLKYIWKFLLAVFIAVLIAISVATLI